MNANGKVMITSEFPTPDEVASTLGIPATRVAELRQIIREIDAERPRRRPIRRPANKQGAAKPARKT